MRGSRDNGTRIHSSLKAVAFMTGVQRVSSSLTRRCAASGPESRIGSKPETMSGFWNSGSAINACVTRANRSTIGFGNPAGANRPLKFQPPCRADRPRAPSEYRAQSSAAPAR
jgi:hypothetical protein